MKRECLLSRAYTGAPLTFSGVEIAYSPLVNEIMRELGNALFSRGGDGSQTEHLALVECIMVMHLIAIGDKKAVADYMAVDRAERNKRCVQFYLDNEEEIEPLKPAIVQRLESAAAAIVESESPGKPQEPARGRSP